MSKPCSIGQQHAGRMKAYWAEMGMKCHHLQPSKKVEIHRISTLKL